MATTEWAVSKNQRFSRANELDAGGEARVYRALRRFWHPVLSSRDLGEVPQQVTLCGQQLVVVRLDGAARVFNDLCAHRGTALSLGKVVDGRCGQELRCPYHGWQYDGEGVCTVIPQRPDLAGRIRARVGSHPAAERYGMVWTCLEDPVFPIPDFPQYEDAGFDHIAMVPSDWNCTAPRRTENFVDLGHFAILHDGYLGSVERPDVPRHEVWRDGPVLRVRQIEPRLEPVNAKFEQEKLAEESVSSEQEWWISMPLTVLLHQGLPGGRDYYLFFHPTPVGPHVTRNFAVHARNFGAAERMTEDLVDFSEMIWAQDKPIVESQRPQDLPEDLSDELHLKGVDAVSIAYRRWLVELANQAEPRID